MRKLLKLLVAEGGGPTQVINESLAGVVQAARARGIEVYGVRYGIRGLIKQDIVRLDQLPDHHLDHVAMAPGAALRSTRDSLRDKKTGTLIVEYRNNVLCVLKAHEIDCFAYIGGDDTVRTLQDIADGAREIGYPLRCLHIPKTIDNDLPKSDHTPGYPSAARFVAQAFIGLNEDTASLPRVYLDVVQGRHAGFLVAASALAQRHPGDGPHLIYMPERAFDIDSFVADVDAVYHRHGHCIVAVSEGIVDVDGVLITKRIKGDVGSDAHGNALLSGSGALGDWLAQKIATGLKIKDVRAGMLGYLPRSFPGFASSIDRQEAREVGRKGVEFAIKHGTNGSVIIKRMENLAAGYACSYGFLPLEDVAGDKRTMPDECINEAGNGVTDVFRNYLTPLVGWLSFTHRLELHPVEKLNIA